MEPDVPKIVAVVADALLPLRRATAVIETIAAQEDYVCIQLYGHPWVAGEYWPMITPG